MFVLKDGFGLFGLLCLAYPDAWAIAREWTNRAGRCLFVAHFDGHAADGVGELDIFGLGDQMFEGSADIGKLLKLGIDQTQTLQAACCGVVDRHSMATEGSLGDPCDDEIGDSLLAFELLGGNLDAFLLQEVHVVGEGGLKELLEERDDTLAALESFGHTFEGFGNFAGGADADFVPVEKTLLQLLEGAICLGACGVFTAECVQHLLQNIEGIDIDWFHGFFAGGNLTTLAQDLGEKFLLASCGSHGQ